VDNFLQSRSHSKLTTPESIKFSTVFARSKVLGIAAAAIWVFGLIEVASADIVSASWETSVACSLGLVGVIAFIGYLYYKSGMKTYESHGSCSAATGDHGCSQAGCDIESGGCLGKFDRELSERIAQMEKEKLSLLLRRKIGVDMILPLFWLAVGLKLAGSGGTASISGALALSVGSIGLILVRLYLGSAVFS